MATVDVYSKVKTDELVGAKRDNTEAVIEFDGGPADSVIESFTVVDDATATSGWLDRIRHFFKPVGLDARLVSFFNEYFELRLIPAKHNTVALRIFVKDNDTVQPNARDVDVPVFEILDNRVDRIPIWGLYGAGDIRVNEVPMNYSMVLGPLDPVPAGTPAGTIIVRTT